MLISRSISLGSYSNLCYEIAPYLIVLIKGISYLKQFMGILHMEKKHKFLLAFSLIFPALICEVFYPGFALYTVPLVLAGGVLFGIFLLIILKNLKVSVEKRVKLLVIFSVTFSSFLTFIFISSDSAESFFKRHVTEELPKGIKFIEKAGIVSLAGGNEKLIFSIPADNFSSMIKNTGFHECTVDELLKLHTHLKYELKECGFSPVYAFRKSHNPNQVNLSGALIITNQEKNLCYLYYWKI